MSTRRSAVPRGVNPPPPAVPTEPEERDVLPPARDPLYPREVLGRREMPGERRPGPAGRAASTAGLVFDSWRRRPGSRRAMLALAVLLFLGGLAMFSFPFATNLYADWKQGRLQTQFRSEETRRAYIRQTVQPGSALTRLEIPALGVDAIVVEGTSPSALRAGAGHYQGTPLPCDLGNAAIAGHRTTYSKPFARLDELAVGDRIVLETPVGTCVYEVIRPPFATTPDDWSVIDDLDGRYLTLTTCHPEGSARERLIVRARLVRAASG